MSSSTTGSQLTLCFQFWTQTSLEDTNSEKCKSNPKLLKISVILEDRRIRLNAWAAKILQIPVQKIKRNKFVNPKVSKRELKNPKSLNFTMNRTVPLTALKKKEDITYVKILIKS